MICDGVSDSCRPFHMKVNHETEPTGCFHPKGDQQKKRPPSMPRNYTPLQPRPTHGGTHRRKQCAWSGLYPHTGTTGTEA